MKTPHRNTPMTARRPRWRKASTVITAAALTVALSGCGTADPEDVEWTKVESQPIVAIDDSTGVYVTGSFSFFGGGDVESEAKIDYKYARKVKGGGLRQNMVSDLYASVYKHANYPGAKVVTIYQDVDSQRETARIEVYECGVDEGAFDDCAMPDGTPMGSQRYRVDIHVPKGSVVEADSVQPEK